MKFMKKEREMQKWWRERAFLKRQYKAAVA
jgi:hypothetical protein